MNKLALMVCLWGLMAGSIFAQVRVDLVQEQEQFLPGEAIPLAVRITNRSGQPLRLGDEPDWLTFTVETREGQVVSQTDYVQVLGEFTLASSQVGTKRVNLEPCFAFAGPNRYKVTAILKLKAWDREVSSQPKFFTINEGAKLWQQEFGLPNTGNATNKQPEIRKYILQQVNYTRGSLRLYLRVTDGDGNRVFRVVPIGSIVSFSRPEPQLDSASNLHLIYQNGPTACSYLVFNPDGDVLLRQTHDITGNRPRLRLNDEGKIMVVGGARRETNSDIPPNKNPDADTDGASTNQVAEPKLAEAVKEDPKKP